MLNGTSVILYEVMDGITDLEVCGLCTKMHSCQYWLERGFAGYAGTHIIRHSAIVDSEILAFEINAYIPAVLGLNHTVTETQFVLASH